MNNKCICRTALATPGLLAKVKIPKTINKFDLYYFLMNRPGEAGIVLQKPL